jgi:predicted deacylase
LATIRASRIAGVTVRAGETRDIRLKVSESYAGDPVSLPVRVMRARKKGPSVFLSAAAHGDETVGTGIISELLSSHALSLKRGTLILVPVVNVFGFESQTRYLPDGRDLNRCFPGSAKGSLGRRVAGTFFEEIVRRCDYGIDLHAAGGHRTNYPNVRGDLSNPGVREMAQAFGSELIVNSKGPVGSLRREATKAGCPTIVFEAGEPLKIQPGVMEAGVRGVINVLRSLKMLAGERVSPDYQCRIERSTWVRAEKGGLLRFHVAPGEAVEEGQPIATNSSVYGDERNVLRAPVDAIVMGMTTLPTVKPGEPVCHLAAVRRSLSKVREAQLKQSRNSLGRRLRSQLATNIAVSEWAPGEPD